MKMRTINITVPEALLERVDTCAAEVYASRSEYIKRALLEQVRFDEANSGPESYRSEGEARRRRLHTYAKTQQDKQG